MCFCWNRRSGHMIIAVFTLAFYSFLFVAWIGLIAFYTYLETGGFIVLGIILIIGIIISVTDLFAIEYNSRWLMMPFFPWMIITSLMMLVALVASSIELSYMFPYDYGSRTARTICGVLIGISLILMALFAYFSCVVMSHIEEIKSQEVRRLQPLADGKEVQMKNFIIHY